MPNDYFNPPNSIWPNGLKKDDEGYVVFYPLGTNKVDISTITWPEGDKLISPFVYQNDKLVGFVDTKALTTSGNTTTTMNYSHIEADFSSIAEGTLTVDAPNAIVKEFKWETTVDSGNTGDTIVLGTKYLGCKTVNDVMAVDPNYLTNDIIDGVWSQSLADLTTVSSMFASCTNLIEFYSDLSSVTGVRNMFYECTNLTTFDADLSSLNNASNMFAGCTNLTTFDADLSSLTIGTSMFYECTNLTTFDADLSSLTIGTSMFYECTNLTSLFVNLPILTDGASMFYGCKLDAPSVKNIIDTINTHSKNLTIGMGCNNTTEDADLFAQEAGYANMTALLATLQAKGWTVTAQYNGRPATTYDLRKPSQNTLPVFVKLEETEEYAGYTSEDGSKKYRLDYFHETTGSIDGYTQFNTIEEAIQHFNIKPIEK